MRSVLLFGFLTQRDINIQEAKEKVKCKPLTSKEATQHLPAFILRISDEENVFCLIMQTNQPKKEPLNLPGLGMVKGESWEIGGLRSGRGAAVGQPRGESTD